MELEHVSFTYMPGTPFESAAVDDVSLSVPDGTMLGVIGHTGSGKSTLMQLLNGLLRPTSGAVRLDGRDIWEKPKAIRAVRFQVGLVFQYPEHQLFEETTFKDIAFGPRNKGLPEAEINEAVRRAAGMAGLSDELLKQSPFDLSGGEKRRAAIAGVLAMEPAVLILDEPTAGLDPQGRDAILSAVAAYRRAHNATVILVSHSMEDIARLAGSVLVLERGRVAMYDTTRAVFDRADELYAMGLDVPAVARVFMKLRERVPDIGGNPLSVEEAIERLRPRVKKPL
ncbi:MAG: energy-coupling factor transporter ATPase [Oscillospiraceae bacterium]|nr:energy-coupling factor transporter ATPase [Oscillospiraceae bacterium]